MRFAYRLFYVIRSVVQRAPFAALNQMAWKPLVFEVPLGLRQSFGS